MLRRLKNLWAWSNLEPTYRITKEDIAKLPENGVLSIPIGSTHAQIIYPDPKKEILRANPEPSIDELLNI